jgi:hypothetical protein
LPMQIDCEHAGLIEAHMMCVRVERSRLQRRKISTGSANRLFQQNRSQPDYLPRGRMSGFVRGGHVYRPRLVSVNFAFRLALTSIGVDRPAIEWPVSLLVPAGLGQPLAPVYSITSSARASSVGGTSTARARAVGKLMTSSNLIDRTTGRSAGLAPLRIRTG